MYRELQITRIGVGYRNPIGISLGLVHSRQETKNRRGRGASAPHEITRGRQVIPPSRMWPRMTLYDHHKHGNYIRTHQFSPSQCKLSIIILYNHKQQEHDTEDTIHETQGSRVQGFRSIRRYKGSRVQDHSRCTYNKSRREGRKPVGDNMQVSGGVQDKQYK